MNLKEEFKRNKGITLIALVVTIIVLLLLAGISITMLTGQNGILNRAAEAKEKTDIVQREELDKLQSYENKLNEYLTNDEEKGIPADTPVTNPESYGTNPNAQATSDGAGKYFAKPACATYVKGTVDTGVVVNINGSEFVWVPVEDAIFDATMEANLPKTEADWNKDTSKTPMAIAPVGLHYYGILYSYSENNDAAYLMYAGNSSYYSPSSIGLYEPVLNSSDTGLLDQGDLDRDYDEMIESVQKYKGFYVARYEAGIEGDNIVFKNVSKNADTIKTLDASENSGNKWYGLYQKMSTFETTSDKVVSSMIWGSQYDAMMNWMLRTGNSVGKILDSSKRNDGSVTGSKESDIINNVYDLYGCHYEWTLENYGYANASRTLRGGSANISCSVAKRYEGMPAISTTSTRDDISSRATIYIK